MIGSQIVDAWNAAYSNHAVLRTSVLFCHVGGLLGGGGLAVSADRATLQVTRQQPAAEAGPLHLRALAGTHRLVIAGLAFVIASGVLLFFSDVDTYLPSKTFWLKMAMVALLLGNGLQIVRQEDRAGRGDPAAWLRLRRAAVASLVLWFVITLLGAALPNI